MTGGRSSRTSASARGRRGAPLPEVESPGHPLSNCLSRLATSSGSPTARFLGRRPGTLRGRLEPRVLGEDRLLEVTQCLARLDPELLDEHTARLTECLERLRLPPAAVEREHQLTPQPLTEGVPRDQRLELADELGGVGGLARRQRAAALLEQPLETVQVELVGADAKQVPGWLRHEKLVQGARVLSLRARALAFRSRKASSARCCGEPTGTRPRASRTSSGPSTLNSSLRMRITGPCHRARYSQRHAKRFRE